MRRLLVIRCVRRYMRTLGKIPAGHRAPTAPREQPAKEHELDTHLSDFVYHYCTRNRQFLDTSEWLLLAKLLIRIDLCGANVLTASVNILTPIEHARVTLWLSKESPGAPWGPPLSCQKVDRRGRPPQKILSNIEQTCKVSLLLPIT